MSLVAAVSGAWRRLACGGGGGAAAAVGRRAVSTGRREFYQRIDEQRLARDLESIAVSGRTGVTPEPTLFNPKVRVRPARGSVAAPLAGEVALPAAGADFAGGGASSSRADAGHFGPGRRRTKPWLHYESLRGTTYPSGGRVKGPRWQDLTHSEAQRLQEMYMKKRMLDRKVLWLKMQDLPNPEKEAKLTVRRQERLEEERKASQAGDMYPPPFLDSHPGSRLFRRMENSARREELESRFRARIREQKLENARIIKANVPSVGGVVTDPIKRHVQRRLVRQREKIHAGLEEFLTRNSAQVLYEFLQGVAISIVKVRAKRPRQTQQIYYNLTSDHDPAWVQRQLNILAPKLRSQLAVKVNMGQTPNIRFVPQATEEVRRAHLWRFAKQLKEQIPTGGGVSSAADAADAV